MSPVPRVRDLRALPKAHLHLHLEAAVRTATLADLARRAGVEVPVLTGYDDFTGFSRGYVGMLPLMPRAEDVLRIIDEATADAAAEGVVHLELSGAPGNHAAAFGGADEALAAFVEQGATSGAEHGVSVALVPTIDRTRPPDEALEVARLAARFAGRGVVGLGLANDERGHPPELFEEAFALARAAGLMSVPHAGELVGPESVRGALDVLGADRLLHGVRSVEDPALVAELADRGTCLDVCPTSNLLLGVYPSMEAHPLPALLDAGVRCSINADDPVIFGPGLLEEHELCRRALGLSDEQLAACAWSSLECSGAPADVVASARSGIDAWMASGAELVAS